MFISIACREKCALLVYLQWFKTLSTWLNNIRVSLLWKWQFISYHAGQQPYTRVWRNSPGFPEYTVLILRSKHEKTSTTIWNNSLEEVHRYYPCCTRTNIYIYIYMTNPLYHWIFLEMDKRNKIYSMPSCVIIWNKSSGTILYMCTANARRRYTVTSTLHCNVVSRWLGSYTKLLPWIIMILGFEFNCQYVCIIHCNFHISK